ncbi:predicted protein [Streptomyces sp. SPB78]|nr:predicted protein [Streptomyces sp. SPB78]
MPPTPRRTPERPEIRRAGTAQRPHHNSHRREAGRRPRGVPAGPALVPPPPLPGIRHSLSGARFLAGGPDFSRTGPIGRVAM